MIQMRKETAEGLIELSKKSKQTSAEIDRIFELSRKQRQNIFEQALEHNRAKINLEQFRELNNPGFKLEDTLRRYRIKTERADYKTEGESKQIYHVTIYDEDAAAEALARHIPALDNPDYIFGAKSVNNFEEALVLHHSLVNHLKKAI